jgi:phosphopantetheine adenylyltransferase
MAKSIAFSFGRFNPPTIGHGKLIDMTKGANRNYRIYASQSQDAKRNPLKHKDKVALMKGMFPQHAKKIRRDKVITPFDILVKLYKEKHTDVVMVVGSDRVKEFEKKLIPYNGKKARHGFFKFKSIRVISAGTRDPDEEGVVGMSASKMRAAVTKNDFKSFQKGLPPKFRGGKKLFKILQKEMGVKRLREWSEMKEVRVKFLKKKLTNKAKTTPADQLIPHDRAPRIEGFREMVARKNI